MKSMFSTLAVGSALALAMTGTAYAGDYNCKGSLGKQHIDGDVVVRSGTCTLNGTTVDGNVKVYSGGALVANNAQVDGDIQAEKAKSVTVNGGLVNGNIQIKESGAIRISKASVDGDIQLFNNRASAKVENNTVNGNLHQPNPKYTTIPLWHTQL
ncbi:MAG: polymer-forming cytoskeletal protein, partial [Moraxella sp.]|nr:polymer-forming cytoskeletal protein [Moraxella sp.]